MSKKRFDPAKHLTKVDGNDYLEVKWRLVWFRDEYPDGRVDTELIESRDDFARFKATVSYSYWIPESGTLEWALGTGYGSAFRTQGKRGEKYAEKAESVALGRALATLGYGTQFADELEEDDDLADAPVQRQPARPPQRQPAQQPPANVTQPPARPVEAHPDWLNEPITQEQWRETYKRLSDGKFKNEPWVAWWQARGIDGWFKMTNAQLVDFNAAIDARDFGMPPRTDAKAQTTFTDDEQAAIDAAMDAEMERML